MMNVKMKIMEKIVDLRNEMDDYREMRMFGKVAEIRLEIARLEYLLSETYWEKYRPLKMGVERGKKFGIIFSRKKRERKCKK